MSHNKNISTRPIKGVILVPHVFQRVFQQALCLVLRYTLCVAALTFEKLLQRTDKVSRTGCSLRGPLHAVMKGATHNSAIGPRCVLEPKASLPTSFSPLLEERCSSAISFLTRAVTAKSARPLLEEMSGFQFEKYLSLLKRL